MTAAPARTAAMFTGLVDLAAKGLGGKVLAASDDFFASKDNLVEPEAAVFIPGKYTEHGKWMDGWESRRRRSPGHDWAVVALGAPGVVRGLDIDTSHFLGNHPPYASVEAVAAERDASVEQLQAMAWTEILEQSPLVAGTQNMFTVSHAASWPAAFTHLRLNIFPDGGVARFRAHGVVAPDWSAHDVDDEVAAQLHDDEVDLIAIKHGGLALACSDSFFGPMNNLILPGRAENMGGGWETRRRRGPGFDWIVLRLGAPGDITMLEVDTNFFKGNCPDRCSVEGIHSPNARLTELVDPEAAWRGVLEQTPLTPHTRHFLRDEIVHHGPFTHIRLSIFPDGGVSRLRT
ncbi:MAG: allantoicase, partial [Myxococcota bacterium]